MEFALVLVLLNVFDQTEPSELVDKIDAEVAAEVAHLDIDVGMELANVTLTAIIINVEMTVVEDPVELVFKEVSAKELLILIPINATSIVILISELK
jgi:hypothetical protein